MRVLVLEVLVGSSAVAIVPLQFCDALQMFPVKVAVCVLFTACTFALMELTLQTADQRRSRSVK